MPEIAMATRCERGQRKCNEDDLRCGEHAGAWYAVLADGAGGHEHGAEASRRVVTHIEAALQQSADFTPQALRAVVCSAHAALQGVQAATSGTQRMHATVVTLWIVPGGERVLWSHVGDSRLYRLRQGAVDFVTRDDSVVQRLVDAGLLAAGSAREHPQKHQLVAALGMAEAVEPNTPGEAVSIEEGDAYLLCSDGWWEALDEATLAQTLSCAVGPQDWLDSMHRLIEQRALPRQDNYSAVAVWIGDPAPTTRLRLDAAGLVANPRR